jgi:CheY-like chemotaxis protein
MATDRLRILVVDDETAQRELLAGFLRKQGHAVLVAASGAEAVARLRAGQVDLVLSDCRMPGMSGLDLLRALRGINPEVPLLLMTATAAWRPPWRP